MIPSFIKNEYNKRQQGESHKLSFAGKLFFFIFPFHSHYLDSWFQFFPPPHTSSSPFARFLRRQSFHIFMGAASICVLLLSLATMKSNGTNDEENAARCFLWVKNGTFLSCSHFMIIDISEWMKLENSFSLTGGHSARHDKLPHDTQTGHTARLVLCQC